MSEMIERVAKAIQREGLDSTIGSFTIEDARHLSRAAIEAMREPNFYMMENGDSAILDSKGVGTTECWKYMIDAALSEKF